MLSLRHICTYKMTLAFAGGFLHRPCGGSALRRRRPVDERINPPPAHLLPYVVKWLAAGVVIFAGIAGGVYTGYTRALHNSRENEATATRNETYLDVGDPFPACKLYHPATAQETTVPQIVARGPAIMLYLSYACGACEAMAGYWTRKVVPELRDDIQIVCVYDDRVWQPAQTEAAPFSRGIIMTADREAQKDMDGISATPTLVAVDTQGIIRLVCTGFDRSVNSDVLNALL